MVSLPSSSSFGNPLIEGIAEIHPPDPIPWTPTAPGWTLLWTILMLICFWMLFRLFIKWSRNAYRRHSLYILKQLRHADSPAQEEVLCALPRLLKYTALKAFPRSRVASLYGETWIAFLESRYADPGFRENAGKHLLMISYQNPEDWTLTGDQIEDLFSFAGQWIQYHRREDKS
jgi:hypothetical protein